MWRSAVPSFSTEGMNPVRVLAVAAFSTSSLQLAYLGPTATHTYKYQCPTYSYLPLFSTVERNRWLEWALQLLCFFVAATFHVTLLLLSNSLLLSPYLDGEDEARCLWTAAVVSGLIVLLNILLSYEKLTRAWRPLRTHASADEHLRVPPSEHPTVWVLLPAIQFTYVLQALVLRQRYPFDSSTPEDTALSVEIGLVVSLTLAITTVEVVALWIIKRTRLYPPFAFPRMVLSLANPKSSSATYVCDVFVAWPIACTFFASLYTWLLIDVDDIRMASEWRFFLPAIEFSPLASILAGLYWHNALRTLVEAASEARYHAKYGERIQAVRDVQREDPDPGGAK